MIKTLFIGCRSRIHRGLLLKLKIPRSNRAPMRVSRTLMVRLILLVRSVLPALERPLLKFNPPDSASTRAEPFLMGQAMLRERFATVRPALGSDGIVGSCRRAN